MPDAPVIQPKTGVSVISTERIEQAIMQRYSPLPELTMPLLAAQLNAFRVGELRQFARTSEIMMERDGDLTVPADKLFSDIARLPWDVEKEDDSAEADADYQVLQYFYNHLTATSVLEADETGGINLLLRQMMTAHAYRYSVHEMLLRINDAGKKEITAEFRHAPVWFFSSRRGRLEYLKRDGEIYGEPLQPLAWLPAVGRGMMRQCAIAYFTKWGPLSDWMFFAKRFGLPGVHGETTAAEGTAEWDAFEAALLSFVNGFVMQTSGLGSHKINLIEAAKGAGSALPFKDLVERADRVYARCFRGGDLSTQSREGGDVAGANPQESEKRIVLEDGGQWATDVLNARVDEPLIAYVHNRAPKAWIVIRPPKATDSNREINTLKAGRELGVPISIDTARERLELPAPEDGDDLIEKPQPPPELGFNRNPNLNPALGNAASAEAQFAVAIAEKRDPFLLALARISALENDQTFLLALNDFYARMPAMIVLASADASKAAKALEQITAPALAAGLQGKPLA